MRRLEGTLARFRSASERRMLVGKTIKYLRHCDIDKSGRGYFFPRVDVVIEAKGRDLIFENGSSASVSDLVEVVVLEPDQ